MNKILTIEKAVNVIKKLKVQQKTIVLAGGCFDILHIGHIKFLETAKKQGDFLIVILESDKSIRRLKGRNRPINTQKDRAQILSALSFVDYVVTIPTFTTNKEYDNLINLLKPDIIATTKGDPALQDKIRQAKRINAKVVDVIEGIPNKSTTNIEKILSER